MKKILDYVRLVGVFEPPKYIGGGYDNLPFTHYEYLEYVYDLYKRLSPYAKDCTTGDITILIMPFEEDNQKFILYYSNMFYTLMTEEYFENRR
jgi:hypothetical protein